MNPETAAEKIRTTFWENERFPVDPVTIARKLGVEVLETELPDQISGALLKEVGQDPKIIVHYADHNNRKRFSCAHELGHYVSKVESNDESTQYEYIDFRSPISSNGTEPEEVFANRFAACLLMPKHIMKALNKKKKYHVEIAAYLGVSNEAVKHRLKNLKLL